MKIRANIKYPPPKFEARDLTFEEACKMVDALTKELVVANRLIASQETVLEHCQAWFELGSRAGTEGTLLREIKEVLK